MGLNIAITSKYNPFTYEDYIKPFEGYWEDYDKYEEDLDKLTTDVATMRSVVNSMSEGDEKTKYSNYLKSLDTQASQLASQGLTASNRKALKNLKNTYSELMPRLALAEEARRKDLAEYTKLANSGEYFLYQDSPIDKTVEDYLDGKLPSYNIGLSKTKIGQMAQEAGKAYSSRVFPDVTTEEITLAGKKFLQVTEEKGIQAALEDVSTNDPRFSAILEELYKEAGIDNMSLQEQEKAEKHIAKNFWEGLAYQKAVDYKPIASPPPPNDPTPVVAHLPNGNSIVRSGNRHFIVDKDNNFIGEWKSNDKDQEPITPSQRAEKFDKDDYLKNVVDGYDVWRSGLENILNPSKAKDHDEEFTNNPSDLVSKYVSSVTDPSGTWARHRSNLIADNDTVDKIFKIAVTKAKNEKLFKKYRQPDNTIIIGSGSAVGKRYDVDKGEFFGDNHISLINVDTFFDKLPSDLDLLLPVLEKVYITYSKIPTHEANQKVFDKIDSIVKAWISNYESTGNSEDVSKLFALIDLQDRSPLLHSLYTGIPRTGGQSGASASKKPLAFPE